MAKDLNEDYFLWKSFKDGGDDSFGVLYDLYAESLFRYGMHFSRDKEFIKDCIHDLFLDLHKYRDKLSMTDSIRFYLFRSLRRKINHKLSKTVTLVYNNNLGSSINNQELPFEESMISFETEAENKRILLKAMKSLTDRQREGLSLKFEHNLSYPEIAEILGMSVESARTSIYRALKTLRKSIKDDESSIYLLLILARHPFQGTC